MSDLDVNVQIRAHAVQAAASLVGPYPSYEYMEAVQGLKDFQELTSDIGMYIKHGVWPDYTEDK